MARILQLCIRYPPAPGGAETHVKSLSEELKKSGHKVEVYTTDLYKEFPFTKLSEKGQEGVKRHKAFTLGGELHYTVFPSLIRSLAKNDFDLYHAHSYGYFHMNTAAFFKHLKEKPLVITPHFHPEWSMWGGEKRKKIRSFYDSSIAQNVIDSADMIIGVSENEISLLSQRLSVPEGKIRVIPNGIDPSKFTPIPDGEVFKRRFDIEGPMVLFTGRLASNKGLLDLVCTVPRVLKDYPDAEFVLVGEDEGMKGKLIEKAADLNVLDSLKILGYVEDYDLFRSAYSAADVYVLPSEYEAFGIVLLEAMMCETPCVATKVGGVPEVIEDGGTGMLVEYGNVEALSRSIKKLLGNKKLRTEMGRRGRKRVLQRFTWKKVAKEVEEVYKGLIDSS